MSVETNNKIGVEVRRAKNKKKQKHRGRLGTFIFLPERFATASFGRHQTSSCRHKGTRHADYEEGSEARSAI
jgi:hypothetical protein